MPKILFLLILLFAQPAFCRPAEELRATIQQLDAEHNFLFIDLGFTEADLCGFDQIDIRQPGLYRRYGELDLMNDELPAFLRTVCANSDAFIQKTADQVSKIVGDVVLASGKETAWVDVRVTLPQPSFDIPRWHTDGPFYALSHTVQYKFAMVLKGNPTRFYPITAELRDILNTFQESEQYHISFEERDSFARLLDESLTQTPKAGQGVLFIVGDPQIAAVHTEPPFQSTRLFISVVPGDIGEIQELKDRWEK